MPGRGQPLRAAAALGGVCYTDRFITFQEHGKQKQEGLRRWSGIPEITLHDKDGKDVMTVGQSNICLQLIGVMGGLYPKDNALQAALVDEVMAAVEDLFGLMLPAYFAKDIDTKKKLCEEYMEEKLPYWCGKFEKRLEENEARGYKNGYFVGDTLTVADLKFYYCLTFCKEGDDQEDDAKKNMPGLDMNAMLKTFPKMGAFFKKVEEDERIKAFEAAFGQQLAKYGAKPEENEIIANENGKCVYLPVVEAIPQEQE